MKNTLITSLLLFVCAAPMITTASTFNVAKYMSEKAQEYNVKASNPYFFKTLEMTENKNKLSKELQKFYDENKFSRPGKMFWLKMKYESARLLSCGIADATIIAVGVGETAPVLNYLPSQLVSGNDFEQLEIDDKYTLAEHIVGGGINSVGRILIETVATYDAQKIEAVIADEYPSTTVVARKVKGDESACYKNKLISDLITTMQRNPALK
jgi:hypothetical protein